MSLVVVLATPLVGAILLVVARGIAARVLHLLATVLTAAAAGAVAVQVSHAGSIVALGGLFRADGFSAWMIGLIALVSLLAAIEAPYTVPSAAVGRFRPLFHLFVFTMLLAVSTDDVGLMWVAIEGTTLASVFLVNLERSRASLEAAYKYLLICSVGVAIAFIGTVLVYFADIHQFGHEAHALRWTTLVRRSEEHTSELQSLAYLVCRLLLEKKKMKMHPRQDGDSGTHQHRAQGPARSRLARACGLRQQQAHRRRTRGA